MTSPEPFFVREVVHSDLEFIKASWVQGLYFGNSWKKGADFHSEAPVDITREIPMHVFFDGYGPKIARLLADPRTRGRVCCLQEDPDVILGYSVYWEDGTLHWVFVKGVWRKMGIGKALLPKNIAFVTHLTKVGKILKPKEWIYNPFLLESS